MVSLSLVNLSCLLTSMRRVLLSSTSRMASNRVRYVSGAVSITGSGVILAGAARAVFASLCVSGALRERSPQMSPDDLQGFRSVVHAEARRPEQATDDYRKGNACCSNLSEQAGFLFPRPLVRKPQKRVVTRDGAVIVAHQTRRMVERKPAGEDATGRKVRAEKSNVSPRKRRSCKNPKPQHHGPEVEKVWLDYKAFTGACRSIQQAREDPAGRQGSR